MRIPKSSPAMDHHLARHTAILPNFDLCVKFIFTSVWNRSLSVCRVVVWPEQVMGMAPSVAQYAMHDSTSSQRMWEMARTRAKMTLKLCWNSIPNTVVWRDEGDFQGNQATRSLLFYLLPCGSPATRLHFPKRYRPPPTPDGRSLILAPNCEKEIFMFNELVSFSIFIEVYLD